MPELNIISTSATDTTGSKGQVIQPSYTTTVPGYNYAGVNNATGDGILEWGSGTPGSLPFQVDQNGNVTGASFTGIVKTDGVDWLNVTSGPYNADNTGATDATAAIQAALTAAQTAGGVIYLPAGKYKLNSGLTYSSSFPLTIFGDGPELSNLLINNAYSGGGIAVSIVGGGTGASTSKITLRDFSILSNVNVASKSDAVSSLTIDSVQMASVYNVTIDRVVQAGQGYSNQGIVVKNSSYVDFYHCQSWANVNSFYITGTGLVFSARECTTGGLTQQGVSTAAAFLADGTLGTIHLSSIIINAADRGILATQPAFWELYDVEVNNCVVSGMDFEDGSQVWASNCWISILHSAYIGGVTTHGLIFGTAFVGNAYFSQLTIQGYPEYSIWIQGGSGYVFTGATIGNGAKTTANTYDEIHIAAAASNVIVNSCFLDVTPNYAINGTAPRSALYIESGATNVVAQANVAAGNAAYGTGSVVDPGNVLNNSGNIGLGKAVGFQELATTGIAGFALQNATPNILTWTAPNDGLMHRVSVMATLVVTTLEVGGAVNLVWTSPGSTSGSRQVFAAAEAAGTYQPAGVLNVTVAPNTTVTLSQTSALTGGAATVYAEIWGS